MKKSLIALAVVAAAGAASAQSNVQLYGVADMYVGSFKNGAPGAQSLTEMRSGGLARSRWGIKGSEDLGGGLKAIFKLESRIELDRGQLNNATTMFDRGAYVGLAGSFGEVTLGRNWTALDDVYGLGNSSFDGSALAITNAVWASAGYNGIPNNGFKYTAPSFGGFTGAVSYNLDETPGVSTSVTSFNVAYANGPVAAALGYQIEGAVNNNDQKFTIINGSYDFGMARLIASYGAVSDLGNVAGAKSTDYHIGVDVPLTSALAISGGYAQSQEKLNGVKGDKTTGFGLAAKYTLSKRTSVYAGFRDYETKNGGVKTSDNREFLAGVNHSF